MVADERDVIRRRANCRRGPPEGVRIYPLKGPGENMRRVLLPYVKQINSLTVHPEFYNTLTTNCTTSIWRNAVANPEHRPFGGKILARGYVPQYLYETGRLGTSAPFCVLEQNAHSIIVAHIEKPLLATEIMLASFQSRERLRPAGGA